MVEMTVKHVVTCFLRNRGDILLLRRSEAVGSYTGRWSGVSGHVEGTPEQSAYREIAEETGLADAVRWLRTGEPFQVEDESLATRWTVHPFLFACARRDAVLDWETTEAEWVPPTEILHRETVPQLWTSYTRVAPTVDQIRTDRTHGSTDLSYRALEVVRDQAGWCHHTRPHDDRAWRDLCNLTRELLAARPAMAAVVNRINRVMHACHSNPSAGELERQSQMAIGNAMDADDRAARGAAELAAGRRVFTLSRSETLLTAFGYADPPPSLIVVAESRPGSEGTRVVEWLRRTGLRTALVPDSAIAHVLRSRHIELVLVGADTILPNGDFVNKIGSHLAAMAAQHCTVPCYVATAMDKLNAGEKTAYSMAMPVELVPDPSNDEAVPIFEVTPSELVTAYVTEAGQRTPEDMAALVPALHRLSRW